MITSEEHFEGEKNNVNENQYGICTALFQSKGI